MKLYEYTADYLAVQDMLNRAETEEEFAEASAMLTDIEAGFDDKVENMIKFVRELESESAAVKAEEERLNNRRKTIDNKIKYIKDYVKDSMITADKTRVNGQLFTISVAQTPLSVTVFDISEIPEQYRIPQPDKPDKTALKNYFKETGEVFRGCEFSTGTTLRIK